jgi:hypothetical protein
VRAEPSGVMAAGGEAPAAGETIATGTACSSARPAGPQATMPSAGPKISCATLGSRKAAIIEQPFPWQSHQAVLASCLATSSMTSTKTHRIELDAAQKARLQQAK